MGIRSGRFRAVIRALRGVGIALPLLLTLSQPAKAEFYRVFDGPRPATAAERAANEFLYGAKILYTEDVDLSKGPTRVKGTVWHSTVEQSRFYIGSHNPVLEELDLLKKLENDKWFEAEVLQRHAPEAFPKTENMANVLDELGVDLSKVSPPQRAAAAAQLSARLRKRYPEGFFMKSIDGFDSDGQFPTEKTDFASTYKEYKRGAEPKMAKLSRANPDTVVVHQEMKGTPGYEGRFIDELFRDPRRIILQERLRISIASTVQDGSSIRKILLEYRVHVVQGRVLKGGTLSRWDYASPSSGELRRVERFVQGVLDRLPEEFRRLSYAIDVLATENGILKIIELNTGGDSGYLYPDYDVWVTNLLASKYTGKPTALQKLFAKFESAPTLAAKERHLDRLLKHKALKFVNRSDEPMASLLGRAKDTLMRDVLANPTHETASRFVLTAKRFGLEPFLNESEIAALAEALGARGLPASDAALMLGLRKPGQFLFPVHPTQLRARLGLAYDNAYVQDKVSRAIEARAKQLGMRMSDPTVERLAREIVDENVISRRQLQLKPGYLGEISRDGARALDSGKRLFYAGEKSRLLAEVLKLLIRR